MKEEEAKVKMPWGVVIAKGLAAGVVGCLWWWGSYDHVFLSMVGPIVVTAAILSWNGVKGWWISSGIAAALWWGNVFLYPSYARLFLDFEVSDLFFTYESVYFEIFFPLTLILLFLIWLVQEAVAVLFHTHKVQIIVSEKQTAPPRERRIS